MYSDFYWQGWNDYWDGFDEPFPTIGIDLEDWDRGWLDASNEDCFSSDYYTYEDDWPYFEDEWY